MNEQDAGINSLDELNTGMTGIGWKDARMNDINGEILGKKVWMHRTLL